MLRPSAIAALLLAAASVTGCATPRDRPSVSGLAAPAVAAPATGPLAEAVPAVADSGGTCMDLSAHSTTVGEEETRSIAESMLADRITEQKGRLRLDGARRIDVSTRRTDCNKHLYLGPGLQEYHCLARARVCGHQSTT
ncbi:MAG: hypothetical protein R3D33_11475 [Hyphomicrobiaceae bacterium]